MTDRRALFKLQEQHDEYKAAQITKIKEVKTMRFPEVDNLVDDLKKSAKYTQVVKYIQYLELINIGTWCDKCNSAKTVHTDDADEFVKQLVEKTQISQAGPNNNDLTQLKADVASLKTITALLNSRVSAIESTIAAIQKSNYKIDPAVITADELIG